MGKDAISRDISTEKPSTNNVDSSPLFFIIIAFSIIGFLLYLFRDPIKEWIGKNKKILKVSDVESTTTNDEKQIPELPTEEKITELPETTSVSNTTNEIQFELEQPNLDETDSK